MNVKNKRIAVMKVKRGCHKVFTDNDRIQMISMYHKDKMTQQKIADHFGTTRQNINRLLKKQTTNIEIKDGTMLYNSDEILKRRSLSIEEREKLIAQDVIEVVEFTFSLIKVQLENLVRILGTSDELNSSQIDINMLVKLLQTVLPYVIPKQEAKGMKEDETTKRPLYLNRLINQISN